MINKGKKEATGIKGGYGGNIKGGNNKGVIGGKERGGNYGGRLFLLLSFSILFLKGRERGKGGKVSRGTPHTPLGGRGGGGRTPSYISLPFFGIHTPKKFSPQNPSHTYLEQR